MREVFAILGFLFYSNSVSIVFITQWEKVPHIKSALHAVAEHSVCDRREMC